jgi:hypothetical protein
VRNDAVGPDEEIVNRDQISNGEAPSDLFDFCMSTLSLMGSRMKWKERVWKLFNRFTAAKSWLALIRVETSFYWGDFKKKPGAIAGAVV